MFKKNEEECVCSVCLFRCNIFIGVRIIKEMSDLVASGKPCISILIPYTLPESKKYAVFFFSVRSDVFGFCKSAESSIPVLSNTLLFYYGSLTS